MTARCVLDSDVMIGVLDASDAHHDRAARSVLAMIDGGVVLAMSAVNYAEILVGPAGDERTLRQAQRAVRALGVEIVSPSATIARDAARFRRAGVSLPDGFALATARALEADLATFDERVLRILPAAGLRAALLVS